MPKWVIFLLFALLSLFRAETAAASTIPTKVSSGYNLLFSGYGSAPNNLFIGCEAGFNDRFAVGLQYATPASYFTLVTLYSFNANCGIAVHYTTSNPAAWMADLRYKYDFNESLALACKLSYDGINPGITGQMEYRFNDEATGNAGIYYNNSVVSALLGVEFDIAKIKVGVDYCFTSATNSAAGLYVKYKF